MNLNRSPSSGYFAAALLLVLLASTPGHAQTLVFTDNFNRVDSASLGGTWDEAETGPDSQVELATSTALLDLALTGGTVDRTHASNVHNTGPSIGANFTPRGLTFQTFAVATPLSGGFTSPFGIGLADVADSDVDVLAFYLQGENSGSGELHAWVLYPDPVGVGVLNQQCALNVAPSDGTGFDEIGLVINAAGDTLTPSVNGTPVASCVRTLLPADLPAEAVLKLGNPFAEGASGAGASRVGDIRFNDTNVWDDDLDDDGIVNGSDNCPSVANPLQEDTDSNGVGDACNGAEDGDGDEWADGLDVCPAVSDPGQEDTDGNGLGDACNGAEDGDGDEWADGLDVCPAVSDPGQEDSDSDGVGDACDNCQSVPNTGQEDTDSDSVGDACNDADDLDGDEWADAQDICPNHFNPVQLNVCGAGLSFGNSFRLVFATTAKRAAESADIADYNAFVSTAANSVPELAALGTAWTAIVSTALVDARDNTSTNPASGSGSPIYNLAGELVANGNADLWDGSLSNPVRYGENGDPVPPILWSGTLADGTKSASCGPLGAASPTIGGISSDQETWIDINFCYFPQTEPGSLYGISGVLTVGGAPAVPALRFPALLVLVALLTLVAVRTSVLLPGRRGE